MFRVLLGLILLLLVLGSANAGPADPYRHRLTREVHFRWGLDGPTGTMAAQIEQESGWRPDVCSPFACGLTQFTPSTAAWISRLEPELSSGDRFSPAWAIRAMVLYDYKLYNQVPPAATECDRWAFVLSSYNGGLGWLKRDVAVCWRTNGCNPSRWWGNVALYSKRAGWAIKENRGYPFRILRNQSYSTWGRTVSCSLPRSPFGSISSPAS